MSIASTIKSAAMKFEKLAKKVPQTVSNVRNQIESNPSFKNFATSEPVDKIINALRNAGIQSMQSAEKTKQDRIQGQQPISNYFSPTPQFRTRDVVREIGTQAKDLVQSIPRGVVSNVMSSPTEASFLGAPGLAANKIMGNKDTLTPTSKIAKTVLGKEPITSSQKSTIATYEKKRGVNPKIAETEAMLAAIAGLATNVIPAGKGTKGIKIAGEDKQIMSSFIDFVRGGGNIKGELAKDAERIADHYNLWDRKTQSLGDLVGIFDNELQKTAKTVAKPVRNELGNRYAGSKSVREVVPPERLKGSVNFNAPLEEPAKNEVAKELGLEKQVFNPPKEKSEGVISPIVRSAYARLEKMGQAGKEIVNKTKQVEALSSTRAGATQWLLKQAENLKLSKLELVNLQKSLRGIEEPTSQRVKAAYDLLDQARNETAKIAQETGVRTRLPSGESIPFSPRKDYMPYVYDPAQFANSRTYNELLDALVKNEKLDWIKSPAEADNFMKRTLPKEIASHLERPRLFEPEDIPSLKWEKNPIKAFGKVMEDNWRRISEAEVFGSDNEIAKNLLEQAKDEGWDYETVKGLYNTVRGITDKKSTSLTKLGSSARALNSFKLTFAAIPNWSQRFVNNTLEFGLGRTAKTQAKRSLAGIGIGKKEWEEIATKSGAKLQESINKFMAEAGGGESGLNRAASWWLRKVRFSATEMANKEFSANIGHDIVMDAYNALLRDPNNKWANKALKDLNLNPKTLLEKGLNDDAFKGGYEAWAKTQFTYHPGEMPAWASTPVGKLLWQFKSYSYNQSKLLYRNLISSEKPVATRAKNWIYFLTMFPAMGEVVGQARDTISGKPRENIVDFLTRNPDGQEVAKRMIENVSWVGGLGIISDSLDAVMYGKEGVYQLLAGPTISSAVEGGVDSFNAVTGKGAEPLGRYLLKQVPGVGGRLQRGLLPTRTQENTTKRSVPTKKSTPTRGSSTTGKKGLNKY